jgi:hypothetical protein
VRDGDKRVVKVKEGDCKGKHVVIGMMLNGVGWLAGQHGAEDCRTRHCDKHARIVSLALGLSVLPCPVDDLVQTGETLLQCARALLCQGVCGPV